MNQFKHKNTQTRSSSILKKKKTGFNQDKNSTESKSDYEKDINDFYYINA
jgi:hypothetical protein